MFDPTSPSHPSRPAGRRVTARHLRRTAGAAAIAAITLIAAACGDDDSSSPATTAGGSATTVSHTTAHAGVVVAVDAVDYAFENLPPQISAGTKLTLRNKAVAELHELVAIRLPDTETRSAADLMRLSEAELGPILGAAPPATVILAAPGGEPIVAVGDGTLTQPGRYLVLCGIPTGVDPAEYLASAAASGGEQPNVPGGPPHFVQGMYTELTVV